MNALKKIFLVGPMGVGKTTIARQVAEFLDLAFWDSDQEIEEHTGVTIPWIFEYEGETGFRKRERAIIAELTGLHNLVLSTGGGVVLNADNRQYLQNRGYVIYLYASVNELLKRTAHCTHRPLLQTANPRNKLEMILKERHPLYQAVADTTINTDARTIPQVVKMVLKHLKRVEHT